MIKRSLMFFPLNFEYINKLGTRKIILFSFNLYHSKFFRYRKRINIAGKVQKIFKRKFFSHFIFVIFLRLFGLLAKITGTYIFPTISSKEFFNPFFLQINLLLQRYVVPGICIYQLELVSVMIEVAFINFKKKFSWF